MIRRVPWRLYMLIGSAGALVVVLVLYGVIASHQGIRVSPVPPPANSLRVEAYDHRGWWEFRYPQYGITTANEMYLPAGRSIAFSVHARQGTRALPIPEQAVQGDVTIDSPSQSWFTVATARTNAVWVSNSAARTKTRFLLFVVSQGDFTRWSAAQQAPAVSIMQASTPPVGYTFPHTHSLASERPPAQLTYNPKLVGERGRGEMLFAEEGKCITCHTVRGKPLSTTLGYPSTCMACHTAEGNPLASGIPAPDLTHLASRTTIAGGLYPNDRQSLTLWLENAPVMKAGVVMPTFGKGQYDPRRKAINTAGLTDQQIADLVAYLQSLR